MSTAGARLALATTALMLATAAAPRVANACLTPAPFRPFTPTWVAQKDLPPLATLPTPWVDAARLTVLRDDTDEAVAARFEGAGRDTKIVFDTPLREGTYRMFPRSSSSSFTFRVAGETPATPAGAGGAYAQTAYDAQGLCGGAGMRVLLTFVPDASVAPFGPSAVVALSVRREDGDLREEVIPVVPEGTATSFTMSCEAGAAREHTYAVDARLLAGPAALAFEPLSVTVTCPPTSPAGGGETALATPSVPEGAGEGDASGCGCVMAGRSPGGATAGALLLVLVASALRARRRAPA